MSSVSVSPLFVPAEPPFAAGTVALERLHPGGVLTLSVRRAQVLRIDSGCAWVTLGAGALDSVGCGDIRAGDMFVHAGQSLPVPAGTRAVIEAARGMELRFVWQGADAAAC